MHPVLSGYLPFVSPSVLLSKTLRRRELPMQKEKGERVGISGTFRAPCFIRLSTFCLSLSPSLEDSAEERASNAERKR